MEAQDSKRKIVKETFPSELISIIGDILAGIVLSLLILPFESFPVLILIIPALLSLRGNISGPFIARTSRDLIIGEFNRRSIIENIFATYILSLITAFLIGIFSIIFNFFLMRGFIIPILRFIEIPLISILFTLTLSIPISIGLNLIVFKFGLNPNNIVNPIMTAVGDFLIVIGFYLSIILLGVP